MPNAERISSPLTADASASVLPDLQARIGELEELFRAMIERVDALRSRSQTQAGGAEPQQIPAPRPPEPEPVWRLKLDEQSVFGPLSLSQLHEWICQCRVGPGHQVSRDGQHWMPAKDVAELRMEWMITLADGGEYGPTHVMALPQLVADRTARPDARVVHRVSGQSWTADRLLPLLSLWPPPSTHPVPPANNP